MAKIVCLSGANADYEYELPNGDNYEVTLGRSDENDICVLDRKSSRFHCKLIFSGESMTLEDRGSTNGVMVNNIPVQGSVQISFGDFIIIGQTVFAVLKENSAPVNTGYESTSSVIFDRRQSEKNNAFETTNTTTFRRLKTEQRGANTGFLTFFEKKNPSGNE